MILDYVGASKAIRSILVSEKGDRRVGVREGAELTAAEAGVAVMSESSAQPNEREHLLKLGKARKPVVPRPPRNTCLPTPSLQSHKDHFRLPTSWTAK